MINLRIGGIIAGAAFFLSFLICLISQVPMPMLVLRPVFFAFIFFVISGTVNILVGHFLPELLEDRAEDPIPMPGSRINISEADTGLSQGIVPDFSNISSADAKSPILGAQPDDSDDDLGDISNLLNKMEDPSSTAAETKKGMDQNAQAGYNNIGALEAVEPEAAASPAKPAVQSNGKAGASGSDDLLPDFDSMAGAFMYSSSEEEPDTDDYSVSAPSPKSSSSKNAPAWTEDFNAKDMAEGLRTILKKDKEG